MNKKYVYKAFAYRFVLILCVCDATCICAQQINTTKVDNKELVKFAANLQVVGEHRAKAFLVKLFKVANAPSPFADDSDEVDHFLYLLVARYGEANATNSQLYRVGPVFYPDKFSWGTDQKSGKELLAFRYLTKTKKAGLIYISLNGINFVQSRSSRN